MKALRVILVSAVSLVPFTASAQKWEVGAVGGGSFYTAADVRRSSGTAEAGFGSSFAAGFVASQTMGRYWGGEVRYTFMRNNAELRSGGTKASFGAQAHVIHYDFLLHFSPSGHAARPYVAFGAGTKYYRGIGPESITQPLSEFALLTKTNEITALVSAGLGVKFRVGQKASIRFEFRDYMSPVPAKMIQPNRNSSVSGWLHNFVPMFGIAYVF
ncbi:MAG: outer membrane beta-barrel protein [Acidobacteria bacterium]|nr:outer membrane beta-barrel protein [Acidobacteriota bacterium]